VEEFRDPDASSLLANVGELRWQLTILYPNRPWWCNQVNISCRWRFRCCGSAGVEPRSKNLCKIGSKIWSHTNCH